MNDDNKPTAADWAFADMVLMNRAFEAEAQNGQHSGISQTLKLVAAEIGQALEDGRAGPSVQAMDLAGTIKGMAETLQESAELIAWVVDNDRMPVSKVPDATVLANRCRYWARGRT